MESQKEVMLCGSQRVSGSCKKIDVEERALPMSGKPTTVPLPASLEIASPLSCFVKKLEPELKSSCVQANGLFTTYS